MDGLGRPVAGGGSGVSSGQGDTASMGTSDDYYVGGEGRVVRADSEEYEDYDDDLSEGSDLLVADSDEEDGGGDGGDGDGISDPRQRPRRRRRRREGGAAGGRARRSPRCPTST